MLREGTAPAVPGLPRPLRRRRFRAALSLRWRALRLSRLRPKRQSPARLPPARLLPARLSLARLLLARLLLACLLLTLPLAGTASAAGAPAFLVADEIRLEGADRLVASGAVEVLYGGARLRARRITYDRRDRRLDIEGPITLQDGERLLLLASAAELSDDLRSGILRSARMVLDDQVQMAAASIRREGGNISELRRAVVSSCEVCADNPTPLWEIRAARVTHDAQAQRLWFENASLRLMGVPVLWLPWLQLPDPTVERASGLLVPKIRTTSQLGTGLQLPWFQTLGPSRDLLLTPWISPRTRTLELRYRQAFANGALQFDGALSRDRLHRDGVRAYLFGQGRFALGADFTLGFGIEAVSDPAYLLDYDFSGKDRLASVLRLERVRRDELIVARLVSLRSLRADEIPIEDTLPFLLAEAQWQRRLPGLAGGEGLLALSFSGVGRRSDLDAEGRDVLRLGGLAGWERRWRFGPGVEAHLQGRLELDGWWVRQDGAYPDRLGRAVPAAALTLRWPLARPLPGGGLSVIAPVVQLAWSQVIGDTPPDEDSTLAEFGEANLLALDRFAGHDRREEGLRAVLGLSWSHFGADWQAGMTLGRILRAEAADFPTASGLGGQHSDWLLAGHLSAGSGLFFSGRLLLDDHLALTRAEARLEAAGERGGLSATYARIPADPDEGRERAIDELTLAGRWQMGRNWLGQGGLRYDLDLDRASRADLGLRWRNECLSLDLSLSRRFTSSTSVEPTTSVGLSLALNGFGTDGREWRRGCRS